MATKRNRILFLLYLGAAASGVLIDLFTTDIPFVISNLSDGKITIYPRLILALGAAFYLAALFLYHQRRPELNYNLLSFISSIFIVLLIYMSYYFLPVGRTSEWGAYSSLYISIGLLGLIVVVFHFIQAYQDTGIGIKPRLLLVHFSLALLGGAFYVMDGFSEWLVDPQIPAFIFVFYTIIVSVYVIRQMWKGKNSKLRRIPKRKYFED